MNEQRPSMPMWRMEVFFKCLFELITRTFRIAGLTRNCRHPRNPLLRRHTLAA